MNPVNTTYSRKYSSCAAVNDKLYAISGPFTGSVEVLDVSDMNDIQNQEFNVLQYIVPISTSSRAVVYANSHIFVVFGDWNINKIYMIDVMTDLIADMTMELTDDAGLWPKAPESAVVVFEPQQRLYVFGGINTNYFQYFNLLSVYIVQ